MCNTCLSMFGYTRDCQSSINGYRSPGVSDCSPVSSHSSAVISTSRSGLMAITNGTDVSNNGHHSHHHTNSHHHRHPLMGHHTPTSHGHHHHSMMSHHNHASQHNSLVMGTIYDVWKTNFTSGMSLLRKLVKNYKYVAVDTEFPGVVCKVFGEYCNSFDQSYHNIKINIDLLKPIQIGFSFFNEMGDQPEPYSTVQFNFFWDINTEAYAADSIQLLENSGINFEKLKTDGIDVQDFGEAFTTSGLALNDSITWIGFHSAYDWAYLLKVCTNWDAMPEKWVDFHKILTLFFPRIIDIKTMVNESKVPKSGLQELADHLKVMRVGAQHQAGSDAKITGDAYFRFVEEYAEGKLDEKQVNYVYGLNYCPNGANNLWTPMNAASPVPEGSGESGNNASSSSSSTDNSGRTSPAEAPSTSVANGVASS